MTNNLMLDDNHTMVVGPSGSGKTMKVILPYLLDIINHGDSFVVTDGKDKILDMIYNRLINENYKIVTLNLRNVNKGYAWNPLTMPYQLYLKGKIDESLDLLSDLASNIMFDNTFENSNDPFWMIAAKDMFVGLTLALFEEKEVTDEMVNLKSIYYMSSKGFEKQFGRSYIDTYFEDKSIDSLSYTNMLSTLQAPNDTRKSILSVFNQKLLSFVSKNSLWEKLCTNEIDFNMLTEEKTAIFIIFEDEKNVSQTLVNVFLRQLYDWFIRCYDFSPRKYHFVIDDFSHLSPFNNIQNMLMSAKSRNVYFLFAINTISLLEKSYGEFITGFLMNNCKQWIIFKNNELKFVKNILEIFDIIYGLKIDYSKLFNDGQTIILNDDKFNVVKLEMPKIELMHYYKHNETSKISYEVFKIDEYVQEKNKMKLNNRIGINETSPGLSTQEILDRLDKKIAELEREEELEKKKEASVDEFNKDILESKNGIETEEVSIETDERDNNISIDEDKEINILFKFKSIETKKEYVAYTDGTKDNDHLRIYVGVYSEDESNNAKILPIENQKEYDIIKKVLNDLETRFTNLNENNNL